jgi:hypothetical protein
MQFHRPSKRTVLMVVATITIIVVGLLLFFLSRRETSVPSKEETFKNATVQPTPIPEGQFDDMEVLVTSDYHILYFGKTNEFLISVTGTPFDRARNDAEQALLQTLNISEEKACTLLVTISTPLFANPQYAGQSFGLSFCD